MQRSLWIFSLLIALLAANPARAQVQTSGQQQWPGKWQVGFHPIGGQAGFDANVASGYKLTTDFQGLIASPGPVSLWLGGGFNYAVDTSSVFFGCANCSNNDLQFWAFVSVTLEKLINFPIVPFVRAGLGGDVLLYGDTAGAFIFRFGGGVDYWIIRHVGLGLESNFTFGPGFGPNNSRFFYGSFDFLIGARFAF